MGSFTVKSVIVLTTAASMLAASGASAGDGPALLASSFFNVPSLQQRTYGLQTHE